MKLSDLEETNCVNEKQIGHEKIQKTFYHKLNHIMKKISEVTKNLPLVNWR